MHVFGIQGFYRSVGMATGIQCCKHPCPDMELLMHTECEPGKIETSNAIYEVLLTGPFICKCTEQLENGKALTTAHLF